MLRPALNTNTENNPDVTLVSSMKKGADKKCQGTDSDGACGAYKEHAFPFMEHTSMME